MARNDGYAYREHIGSEAEDRTLLAYLVRRYPHSSPLEWTSRIETELVLLDGKPASTESLLRPGQALTWHRPPWEEPDAPTAFTILLEDEDLLAVAKPAGLPTLPGAGFLQSTLLHVVRLRAPDATPLHRLGRWTSGIVLFARTREARADLARQWAAREVGKRYRALAEGHSSREVFEIADPIGPVPHTLLGTVHAASPDGRASLTRVVVLEQRAHGFLCDVHIGTGRAHQIRIHLAAAGHPLVGDPLYLAGGGVRPDARAVPGDPGYHLHAAELAFRHPRTGRDVTVACAPPPVLQCSGP